MISVRFKCNVCGYEDVVQVPARDDPKSSVVHWMERVVSPRVHLRHSSKSRNCASLSGGVPRVDIVLPMDKSEDAWVGKQTDRVPPTMEEFRQMQLKRKREEPPMPFDTTNPT